MQEMMTAFMQMLGEHFDGLGATEDADKPADSKPPKPSK